MFRDVGSLPAIAASAQQPQASGNGEKSQDGNELRNDAEDHRLDSAST
jgi:hypothetical protein